MPSAVLPAGSRWSQEFVPVCAKIAKVAGVWPPKRLAGGSEGTPGALALLVSGGAHGLGFVKEFKRRSYTVLTQGRSRKSTLSARPSKPGYDPHR